MLSLLRASSTQTSCEAHLLPGSPEHMGKWLKTIAPCSALPHLSGDSPRGLPFWWPLSMTRSIPASGQLAWDTPSETPE